MKVRDALRAIQQDDGLRYDRQAATASFNIRRNREQLPLLVIRPMKYPGHIEEYNEAARYQGMKYAVVFEQGASSLGATVPDLPGCVAVAKTLGEARVLSAEAIEFHIEGMRLRGEIVPGPANLAELVEVG